jgi:hypothetical protein
MDILITINTDNAAFERDWRREVRRILRDTRLEDDISLRDINGNTVGHVSIYPVPE